MSNPASRKDTMNIYTTYRDDIRLLDEMFKKYGGVKLLEKTSSSFPATDLLIFPGGEDVNPARYGRSIKNPPNINKSRDEFEFSVAGRIIRRQYKPKKVLGICRGMQLLAVAHGGRLFYDIKTDLGADHAVVHDLRYTQKCVFEPFLPRVNSYHHQGVATSGVARSGRVLAVEPETGVNEIILWENNILGFQFHPEYFSGHMQKTKETIADTIIRWVNGAETIVEEEYTGSKHRKSGIPEYDTFSSSNLIDYAIENLTLNWNDNMEEE